MSIGLDTPKVLIEFAHKEHHMYQMPSQKLVMRMHQLVSNLNITPKSHTDSIAMMKMEALSIMTDLAAEYEKLVDKFAAFDDFDLQVILYSKGWYAETDTFSDIRTLIGKVSGMEAKYVSDLDVLQRVGWTLHKIWDIEKPGSWDHDVLYKETWTGPFWKVKESITLKEHVDSLLRVMHMKTVSNYPKLPTPSADYLPLAHADSLDRWAKLQEPLTSSKV